MFERIPEPELMDAAEQAAAYASADWEEAHSQHIARLEEAFPSVDFQGPILDLGCGPGDITFRLATRYPRADILGIDGAASMLELAEKDKQRKKARKVSFICGILPDVEIPDAPYDLIISTSFLHHLHDPHVLWRSIRKHARPGTSVFVVDLYRPDSKDTAAKLVNRYAEGEPEVLRTDFYNSFLAAFTPEEVRDQLRDNDLSKLQVRTVNDRHLVVHGRL